MEATKEITRVPKRSWRSLWYDVRILFAKMACDYGEAYRLTTERMAMLDEHFR